MNESSPSEARFDETPETATRQIAASDWNRAEVETQPEPAPRKERLFPRKVLIGWALAAVVVYFGVQIVATAVKASVAGAVRSGVASSTATQTKDGIVIQTPNGTRITIGRDRARGPSVIVTPGGPARPIPPVTATSPATGASNASAAPSPIPAEPKKR